MSISTLDTLAPTQFDDRADTRFHIDIYSQEWGFFFCHGGKASWIRITDIPFVHGRDDFGLITQVPALSGLGGLMRSLEAQNQITFKRRHALIRTNLPDAEPKIRRWVESL